MIAIQRKLLFMTVCNWFFISKEDETQRKVTLHGFSHALIPLAGTRPLETIHIDLTKSEETLFAEIVKENRRQIRKAKKSDLQGVVLERPSLAELKRFQSFYNRHAIVKETHKCRFYHVRTMQKLAEMGRLTITFMTDSHEERIYCYRIYVSDGEMAMTLYSASNVLMKSTSEERRILSEANRYLIWKNMLRLKAEGVKKLDMGGMTDQPSIQKFKQGFGGNTVTVYSGYTAHSSIGQLALAARNVLLGKGRG